MSIRIGVDIGGTFTDVVLFEENAGLVQTKTPSTPSDPSEGALNGIEKILDQTGISGSNVDRVFHGTTVATNAVIEQEGVDTALITTDGFRDILQIGRQSRPHLYDFWETKPAPLVERKHRFTVSEKLNSDGSVKIPLEDDDILSLVDKIDNSNVDSVAICLLHSYANSEHESQISEVINSEIDNIDTVLSSNILPEYREYERLSTTVINAYVQPLMSLYINRLKEELADLGINASLQIMQSNGGLMSAKTASEKSVHTLLSGPSAGVLTGQLIGEITHTKNIVTFDMGGTSADICTIQDGNPEYSVENELGGHPVRVRMHDINAIGAGGGSIGWIDQGGALRVGPKSAGSDPGPICYGRGGTKPTVTDANLVLGRLNPDYLLEGDLSIKYDQTIDYLEERIAEPLNLSIEDAAEGIIDIVIANMVRGIRGVSVERGYDPRESSLIAFGGAGPLHAYRLIQELDMNEAIIPMMPGVASSLGLLSANPKHNYVRTIIEDFDALTSGKLRELFSDLEKEAEERLAIENISNAQSTKLADMKYQRQGYELTVTVPDSVLRNNLDSLAEIFKREHEREYGFVLDGEPIEIVNLRLQTVAPTDNPSFKADSVMDVDVATARVDTRETVFNGEQYDSGIYKRQELQSGHVIPGPAIIEELSSTTVIAPKQEAHIDDYGIIHIMEVNK